MTDKSLEDTLASLRAAFKEWSESYAKDCDEFWSNLTEEQRLMAFYSVCKRINQGDIIDRGSYRWVLYDVFKFGPESYTIGMECNYMEIHNAIQEGLANKGDY